MKKLLACGAALIALSSMASAQTYPPWVNYVAWGDSVTYGATLPNPATQNYAYLISQQLSLGFTNNGAPGTSACDNISYSSMPFVQPAAPNGHNVATIMFGTNDANVKGAGPYEAVYNQCSQAEIAWLAMPALAEVAAQSATAVGTWTAITTPQTGVGRTSTTNASTLAFTITTTGKPLYIWYVATDGNAGTFTYQIDAGSPVTVNCFSATPIVTQDLNTSAMFFARVTGVSAATHTVLITVTSATGAGNSVGIWGIGSPPATPYAGQINVYVGGIIPQEGNADAVATAAYNADSQLNAALLSGDGLLVSWVNVRNYLTVNNMAGLHPNVAGQIQLEQAYLATMQINPAPGGRGLH